MSPFPWKVKCFGMLAGLLLTLPTHAKAPSYRDTLRKFVADTHFNGVILVGKGERVEYVEAFGVSDAEAKKPLTQDSRFFMGSVSKWVCALVVLRLVDEGKLQLDAPITTYLPEYRADTGRQVTLRHLLSHGSGIPNDLMAAYNKDKSIEGEMLPLAEAVKRYASGNLAFKPGERFDYALSNWILVQAIVERVSGSSYPEAARRLVFEPLHMEDSGIGTRETDAGPKVARGYRQLAPTVVRRAFQTPNYVAGGGGFYSTARDMLRLNHGVLSGTLLSPESKKALLTVERPESAYALGGRVRVFEKLGGGPKTVASNDGTAGAFRSLSWRVLEDGRTLLFLSNVRPDDSKLFSFAEAFLEARYP